MEDFICIYCGARLRYADVPWPQRGHPRCADRDACVRRVGYLARKKKREAAEAATRGQEGPETCRPQNSK